MNGRLPQDAADTLIGYEQQQKWRNRVLAEREKLRASRIVGTWAPVETEQQRMERKQQIEAGLLPF